MYRAHEIVERKKYVLVEHVGENIKKKSFYVRTYLKRLKLLKNLPTAVVNTIKNSGWIRSTTNVCNTYLY